MGDYRAVYCYAWIRRYEYRRSYKNDNYTIVSKDYLFAGKSIDVTELNKNTVNAFLAAEDKRFYEHEGVDYARTVAAAVKDIKEKKFAQGGSTITQQLAKNMFLSFGKNT